VTGQPVVVNVSCASGITAGKAFNCLVSAIGGTGPYTGTGTFSVTEQVKGTHVESFTVKDANGVSASGTATVMVNGQPLVVSVVCPPTATAGVAFTCTVTASGGTAPYSGTCSFQVTQPVKGTFLETFTVTDMNAVTASGSASVMVSPQPLVASFTVTGTLQQFAIVTFTATVTGGTAPYAFSWNFGDNSAAGTGNPTTHTYATSGTFTVTLTVTDMNAATASSTQVITIAPLASTTCGTSTCTVASNSTITGLAFNGTAVTFTSTGTTGQTAFYNVSIPISSVQSQASIQVIVNGAALPASSVTITSDASNYFVFFKLTFHSTFSITIVTDQRPVAAFTFTPTNPAVGQTVMFDASSSHDDGSITNYTWSFGDTTTSTGVSTTHVYAAPGSFVVTLTVTDNRGLTATASTTVTVGATGAHASFYQWGVRPLFKKFSISRQGPIEPIQAFGINDGNQTIWVYTQFKITGDGGVSQTLYTQVVQLVAPKNGNPTSLINGNTDPRFAASFTPTIPGTYTVLATIWYSTATTMPAIGDPSFTPNPSQASVSFLVLS